MNKQEFLRTLRKRLAGLPQEDIEERISFYSEMIDDRIEDGTSEDTVIDELGTVEEIAAQVMSEIPLAKLVKEKVKPGRALRAWEIVLLVLGSPLWLSILLVFFVVILSVYVVLWAVVIALWAAQVTVAVSSLGGLASSVIFMIQGNVASGIAMIGASLVCIGIAIFLCYGCVGVSKAFCVISKKMFVGIKALFVKRGNFNE